MYNEILIYVRKHIRDINGAEDITQDIFLDYSRCKTEIKEPRPYLYRVATSKIIDWIRDRKKRTATTQIDVPAPMIREFDYGPLCQAISLLTENEKNAIVAVYFNGMSTIDAADKLNMIPNTLYSHLDRGREKIRLTLTSS